MAVKGEVKKFATVRPERVNLRGAVGETLEAEVEIIPQPDFPFVIEGISIKKGDFVKYELTRRCTEGRESCLIRVESTMKERGRYVDVLYVETDSRIKPEIPIYIMGVIQ